MKTDIFEARLLALSKAHDLLTRESWEGADLGRVVEDATAPFRRSDKLRFHVAGQKVWLPPRTALALAMALHELCTNAAKYGALSVPSGQVVITWETSGTHPLLLELRGEERGGPVAAAPARKGFGTRLIQRALASELNGEVELRFEPTGVVWGVRVHLGSPAWSAL